MTDASKGMNGASGTELYFLPLGGAGEIGMNLNLYACDDHWLMVDLGVSFGDDTTPGVDVIMPDPQYIVERRDRLLGLVVTHGHEDHLGAVQYLWRELRCPIYATPFAASILRRKLGEAGLADEAKITEVPLGGSIAIGPFAITLITLTHSIPEPNGLAIRTPAGLIVHTGDWKFDPEPLIGDVSDEATLRALGDEGVLALVCDSTNVFREGEAGSEADVRASLTELFGQYRQRIAVGCFATNVARLESIAHAAAANGRYAALVGRSLWRIYEAARENGYLLDIPPFLSDHDAAFLPREEVVLICTGSQGEPRAALARIAANEHPHITLEKGDVVVFSSRIIPGNEKAIGRLQNALVRLGVEIVTEKDHFVHVSGHPARDELVRMYQLVRPKVAIPVHGEARHLLEHARLARDCQVPQTIVVENGAMVRLAPEPAELVEYVTNGRLAVDGPRLVPFDSPVLRSRHRMASNGTAVATVVMDAKGRLLAPPQIATHGLLEEEGDDEMRAALLGAVQAAIEGLPAAALRDDLTVREAVRLAVRRSFKASHGKKPMTDVHLVRV